MAADLHIHVFEGITERDLAVFFANNLGSKYFNPVYLWETQEVAHEKVGDTPNVWVGEVSWLKAAIFEDSETFVPNAIEKISELIGEELPIIDDALIAGVKEALSLPNSTGYNTADDDRVISFLEKHKGKKVFTVSW